MRVVLWLIGVGFLIKACTQHDEVAMVAWFAVAVGAFAFSWLEDLTGRVKALEKRRTPP